MLAALPCPGVRGQAGQAQGGSQAEEARPLPELRTLMQAVVAHERSAEAARKDYLFTTTVTMDRLQKDGGVKKETVDEYENFSLEGVDVARHVRHDGKELSAEDKRKEDERIDKEVAKAKERRAKLEAEGKDTNSRGDEIISISRMFELGSFTNARRVQVGGRDTIAMDFTGDPKAKTRNRGEEVIHDMAGTAWIDEQDKTIQHVEGRFINSFKIGGGLIANIAKDTSFQFTAAKINEEVWLPRSIAAQGHMRVMLLYAIDGKMDVRMAGYRRFRTSSTVLPAGAAVNGAAAAPPQ